MLPSQHNSPSALHWTHKSLAAVHLKWERPALVCRVQKSPAPVHMQVKGREAMSHRKRIQSSQQSSPGAAVVAEAGAEAEAEAARHRHTEKQWAWSGAAAA